MPAKVVTRFAPSPTGLLHVGSVRTMLFSYLYAKQQGGKFLLRIEDTDKERSSKEHEQYIFESMKWLGIEADETFIQSENVASHKKALQKLIDSGHAYISKETPKEEGQRSEVIRFKNPNKEITFRDEVRGDITFDTTDLKDFVIAKTLEEPLYHMAVVVDDIDEGVTHVIRGEDHISNTPRQILIIEALGATRPIYAHLPLILAPDKTKLSKRKHAELVATLSYRDKGFLPEALINFLALLGWNPGTDKEIFSMDELIKEFTLQKIQKAGAVFNVEKLRWMNKEYIKLIPEKEIQNLIEEKFGQKKINPKILSLIKERIEILSDIDTMKTSGEFSYFFEKPAYDAGKFIWKDSTTDQTITRLEKLSEILNDQKDFDAGAIKEAIWPYAESEGRGGVLWPLRYALSGKDKSADPFTLADILGKEESLERIKGGIAFLKNHA